MASSSTALQAVYVRAHESRPTPKPHTVFRIEIQAHVRSWSIWRRYSEFVDLHTELIKSVGSPPPATLPPKHPLSTVGSVLTLGLSKKVGGAGEGEEKMLEERREGLERYLRAIVGCKDGKWRESFAFRDFLGVPLGKQDTTAGASSSYGSSSSQFTSSSWLDEHLDLQARVRDIRADINRRDALSDRGDVGASHTANVQAKKKLAGVITRAGVLADGLSGLAMAGMSEGEVQRRTDMVARLQDDCEKLGKMVTIARHTSRALGSAAERHPASESDRDALLGGGGAGKAVTRVFGAKVEPKETAQTRPLDDVGVFQLQQTQMEQQDDQLSQLTTILQRQKMLGTAIAQEIAEQNEMLDDLSDNVNRVGGKLTAAKKQMNRLG
ncbi:Phox-like protein [Stereum hirsutum FP-91666 SS1]|uniref:Phox-like protein n=1 Tax=Stereum hirsutum (strain FP-91666) TaxID=721885 RepID=UPI000440D091|nr:Phox-like protein [Stereum hirsutum FP-91666 SS1]EIM92969.1 Phox-like protein [Stereum hirsutum FP-91666 SS1]